VETRPDDEWPPLYRGPAGMARRLRTVACGALPAVLWAQSARSRLAETGALPGFKRSVVEAASEVDGLPGRVLTARNVRQCAMLVQEARGQYGQRGSYGDGTDEAVEYYMRQQQAAQQQQRAQMERQRQQEEELYRQAAMQQAQQEAYAQQQAYARQQQQQQQMLEQQQAQARAKPGALQPSKPIHHKHSSAPRVRERPS